MGGGFINMKRIQLEIDMNRVVEGESVCIGA